MIKDLTIMLKSQPGTLSNISTLLGKMGINIEGIAGMQAPPNLGQTYPRAFREVFPALALANDAALIPFLLEGVAANPELNQSDGIHPTAEGHEIMAETVWRVLERVLGGGVR